jgi:hypothetical protein
MCRRPALSLIDLADHAGKPVYEFSGKVSAVLEDGFEVSESVQHRSAVRRRPSQLFVRSSRSTLSAGTLH